MKKILIVFLMMLMFVSPVIGSNEEPEPLTPSQIETIQLTADIFTHCVLGVTKPFVIVGFSTEMAIYFGLKKCTPEGESLEYEMTKAGLTPEEQESNYDTLFKGMVKAVDTARNEEAARRLKEFSEKKKGERRL